MALGKKRIQIQIAKGMQDHGDEFLVEAPNTLFLKDARLYKEGVIGKRHGMTLLADNTLTYSADGAPYLAQAQGDSLTLLTKDSVSTFNGTTWTEKTLGKIYGKEKILSTPPGRGYTQHSVAEVADGYCIVWKIQPGGENYATKESAVLHYYKSDGTLAWEYDLTGHDDPKVTTVQYTGGVPSTLCCLHYVNSSDTPRYRLVTPASKTLGSASDAWGASPATVFKGNPNALIQSPYNPWSVVKLGAEVRPSFAANAANFPMYHTHINKAEQAGAIAALQKDGTTYRLRIQRLSGYGVPLDVSQVVRTTTPSTSDLIYVPLSVCFGSYGGTDFVDVLYSEVNWVGASLNTTVYVERWNVVAGVLTYSSRDTIMNGEFVATQGTINHNGLQSASHFAVRRCYGDETKKFRTQAETYYGKSDGATTSGGENITCHGLASNIEFDDSGTPFVVVQQYGLFYPEHVDPVAISGEEIADIPAAIKGVTSVLVELGDTGTGATPVAVFDAGQSKHNDCAYDDTKYSLGTLTWEHTGGFCYINRHLYSTEDIQFTTDDTYSGGATDSSGFYDQIAYVHVPAEARANLYRVNTAENIPVYHAGFGDGVLVGSALPLWMNGQDITEAFVLDTPEIIAINEHSAADKPEHIAYNVLDESDDWQAFQCVVGFTDTAGNVHRSAPSAVVYASKLGADDLAANTEGFLYITVTAPLSLSDARPYFVELYSADVTSGEDLKLAAVEHFYPRDANITPGEDLASGGSDVGAVYVNYAHVLHPLNNDYLAVRSTEAIYTTGGVLPSDPWPDFGPAVVTSQRMYALSKTVTGGVLYSKLFEDSIAPEFSATGLMSLGDSRKLTAIGALDEKVIVFEKNAIHIIDGTGPNNAGGGSDFSVSLVQSGGIGCEDPESVVQTPDGLMFYSSATNEFHLLDRNLAIVNVGSAIQEIAQDVDIVAATVVPREQEVRFLVVDNSSRQELGPEADGTEHPDAQRPPRPTFYRRLSSGTTSSLVYNYERDSWYTFGASSRYQPYTSLLYQGQWTVVDKEWNVYQESTGWYDSSDGYVKTRLKISTPWIKLDEMQGFARVRKVTFLGRYYSSFQDYGDGRLEAGDIVVTPYYDYSPTAGTAKTFRANVELSSSLGGGNDRLQFQLRPGKQKCQAIRFDIEEDLTQAINVGEPDYVCGRGFEITQIELELGMKDGTVKTISADRKL